METLKKIIAKQGELIKLKDKQIQLITGSLPIEDTEGFGYNALALSQKITALELELSTLKSRMSEEPGYGSQILCDAMKLARECESEEPDGAEEMLDNSVPIPILDGRENSLYTHEEVIKFAEDFARQSLRDELIKFLKEYHRSMFVFDLGNTFIDYETIITDYLSAKDTNQKKG